MNGPGTKMTKEQLDLHKEAAAAECACMNMLLHRAGDLKPHVDKLVVVATDGKAAAETKLRALDTLTVVVASKLGSAEYGAFKADLARGFPDGTIIDVVAAAGECRAALSMESSELRPIARKLVGFAANADVEPGLRALALYSLADVVAARRLRTLEHSAFQGDLERAFSDGVPAEVAHAFAVFNTALSERAGREARDAQFSRHRAR